MKQLRQTTLDDIKERLQAQAIYFSETPILGRPSGIGYEKKFRLRWVATQLNTFVVAIDFGDDPVTVAAIEAATAKSFEYATRNSRGWPRGWQSAIGVITILLSTCIDGGSMKYCQELKSERKWAAFVIPVAIHSPTGRVFAFHRSPTWGWVYYPYFKALIARVTR